MARGLREGSAVQVLRPAGLPGRWIIWGAAPSAAWWLLPGDDQAREALQHYRGERSSGAIKIRSADLESWGVKIHER